MHLSAAVEAVRQSKLLQEEQEHEENEMSVSKIVVKYYNFIYYI